MADAGFFKGTSAEQDSRFANKQKKLLKQMKFPDNIDIKIDMLKINLDILKPWITKRLQELLGIEDDVVIEFVFNQLEDKNPDPKMMQINLTGFLGGSKARLFIGELWNLLASAQSSPDGIPAELVEMKKKELLKRQEEDDRLREIRKREEDSHRQDIKADVDKLDNKSNGRNLTSSSNSKSRNENANSVGYKSRSYYDDDRRVHNRRPAEPKSRYTEKKSIRSISKSSESENDRQEKAKKNLKSASNRHRLPSKSPSHSRSPIKSSRKIEKHHQRSSSTSSAASDASHQATKKAKTRSSSSSLSVDRSHKKLDKPSRKKTNDLSEDPIKEKPVIKIISSKSKKNKKQSKRTRSLSASNSSLSRSRSSSSESESKKNKKQQKKPQITKNNSLSRSQSPSTIRNKKKDDHKSRKHHRSNDNKRKFHRDHPDKFKTKKPHRNESSKKKISNSSDKEILKSSLSPPKKPRLESQIKVQTPPPSDDNKSIKPNRTERIVVLEKSRTDSIGSVSTRVSITTKSIYNDEQEKINNSSEDENEIDLRERLLREKAIKSMKRRQISTNNNDINTKTTNDRIVYETQ